MIQRVCWNIGENYGKRARQRSVREETTKDTTGLYPSPFTTKDISETIIRNVILVVLVMKQNLKQLTLKQTIGQLNIKTMLAYTVRVTL